MVFTIVFLLVLGLECLLYKGGFPEDCTPEFTRFRTALVLAFGLTAFGSSDSPVLEI
jgi:hypothetical protein